MTSGEMILASIKTHNLGECLTICVLHWRFPAAFKDSAIILKMLEGLARKVLLHSYYSYSYFPYFA